MPGTASSLRISSAKMPPTRKKPKAVVMYIAPIFLWSVVVSHS